MSDRTRAGNRCFERVLMCKPYSIWFLSSGREWHDKLKFGTLGQEVKPSTQTSVQLCFTRQSCPDMLSGCCCMRENVGETLAVCTSITASATLL